MPKNRGKYYKSSAMTTFRRGGRAGGFWDKFTEGAGEVFGAILDPIGLGDEVRHKFGTMVGADQTSGALSDISSFVGGMKQGVVGTAANMVGAGKLYNKAIKPDTVTAQTANGETFRNAGQITGKVAGAVGGAVIGAGLAGATTGGLSATQGALLGLQATQSTNPLQTASSLLPVANGSFFLPRGVQQGIVPQTGNGGMGVETAGYMLQAKGGFTPKYGNGGNIGNPNYEAEGDEFVIGGSPNVYDGGTLKRYGNGLNKIQGNSHEQGGVLMRGGEYVVSAKKNYKVPAEFLNDIKHLL